MNESQKPRIFAPKKSGGLGMGSTVASVRSAWLGAWEGGPHNVASALDFHPMTDL